MKFCWLVVPFLLSAQVAKEANQGYKTESGRSGVAENLVKESRVAELRPEELLAAIGVKPGMTVADVGTGAGVLLPYLSEAVGAPGKVVAEDIFPDFLERAKRNASKSKLDNVSFVLGNETDPKLPAGQFDRIITVDVYHHFDYPDKMLAAIGRALKPDGQFVIIDIHKSDSAMEGGRALKHIRLAQADAIREVESHGLRVVSKQEWVPGKLWLGIFAKK